MPITTVEDDFAWPDNFDFAKAVADNSAGSPLDSMIPNYYGQDYANPNGVMFLPPPDVPMFAPQAPMYARQAPMISSYTAPATTPLRLLDHIYTRDD